MPRDLRTLPTWLPLHAPRRRTLPPPTSPAIRSGDSLSLSLSFAEQSQCDGTGRAAAAASATAAAAVAFANLQNALRGTAARGASVAPYALRYSCCRHCRLLLLYRLSHRLLLLLLLLQTRLAIYTLCVQYTKQDRNAQCNVRNFFMMLFSLCIFLLLILSGLTSSWVGTLFDFVLRVVSKFTSVQIHVQCIRLSQIRFFLFV